MQTFTKLFFAALILITPLAAGADGAPYSVERAGDGRSVYLIPGLSNGGDVWDDLAGRLREHGYRTHVLTLAGFGGQPPLDDNGPFLPRVREALAAELAEHEGSRPVVIGHSLGGFMAFWLGASASEHIAGLVAIDGVPFLPGLADPAATPESQAGRAAQTRAFMASLSPEQFARQNRMSLEAMSENESERERIAESSAQSDPATVGLAVAELMTTDLRPLMGRIEVPTLLIQAADSGARESGRAAYAAQIEAIPDHRHVVAGSGRHFVPLDDPEFTAREVLSFLDALDRNGAGE